MRSFIFLLLFISTAVSAQIAKGKCKFLGNIIGDYTPTEFANYWNQITPETAGLWGAIEATRGDMKWSRLDNAYNTAKSNGLLFTEHALVSADRQPSWVGSLSAEEQRQEVEEWFKTFAERYPEADYIEVVDGPLHNIPVYAEALGGEGSTGWDWVIWSFEKARLHFPNAKLILNDHSIVSDDQATDDYIRIINLLKERGLIDYIGEQGHYLEQILGWTIVTNLDKLALTELPILFTAYDVDIPRDPKGFPRDAGQAARYETQFPLIWEHPAVHGVTLWGWLQYEVLRNEAYLIHDDTITHDTTERPALEWLRSYVKSEPGGDFCVTGVEDETDDESFSVYPNPSNGSVNIISGLQFTVWDLQGRLLVTGQGEATLHFNPGLYIVRSSGRSKKLLIR